MIIMKIPSKRLWDHFAERAYEHIKHREIVNERVIMILQYAKMKNWTGMQ